MERGRQRRHDAGHASRRLEGNEEETGRGAGRRVDQKVREGSGPVHPDPEKGDRHPDRKGAKLPAEYPGFPGTHHERSGGARPAAQIRAEDRKRQGTNYGAEPEKKPLNKAGPVHFLGHRSPRKKRL